MLCCERLRDEWRSGSGLGIEGEGVRPHCKSTHIFAGTEGWGLGMGCEEGEEGAAGA